MVFPDYSTISIIATGIVLFGGGIHLFHRTGSSRLIVKVPTRIISGLIVVSSGLLLGIFGCATAWNVTNHSTAIYSPDHLRALRINDTDSGALGGYTWVTLYSHHGLIGRTIFAGDWKAVEPQTVQWLNDSQIVIHYDASYLDHPTCKSVSGVSVRCEPVTYKYPH